MLVSEPDFAILGPKGKVCTHFQDKESQLLAIRGAEPKYGIGKGTITCLLSIFENVSSKVMLNVSHSDVTLEQVCLRD